MRSKTPGRPSLPGIHPNLWGSDPAAWSDGLTGWARLRVIVNAMTRMRFCTPEGNGIPQQGRTGRSAPGHVPWFEAPDG